MELTKEQIQEIDNYISACGIKFYDVKVELVDHFASILEERLKENPELDFKAKIVEEHKKFGTKGFSRLVFKKTNAVHKRFFELTFKHLRSFFKLPKIIFTVGLFLSLKEVMSFFKNKELLFELLAVLGVVIMGQLVVRILIRIKRKSKQFLVLNKSNSFLQIVNFIFILFNSSVTFRSNKSFVNNDYNLIHLAFFVLLLLFYWSGEYVFYQNKKDVKKQYPSVIV